VQLEHEAPHSPGATDPRKLAFFLQQVDVHGAATAAAQAR
jgi:hypothetical protein